MFLLNILIISMLFISCGGGGSGGGGGGTGSGSVVAPGGDTPPAPMMPTTLTITSSKSEDQILDVGEKVTLKAVFKGDELKGVATFRIGLGFLGEGVTNLSNALVPKDDGSIEVEGEFEAKTPGLYKIDATGSILVESDNFFVETFLPAPGDTVGFNDSCAFSPPVTQHVASMVFVVNDLSGNFKWNYEGSQFDMSRLGQQDPSYKFESFVGVLQKRKFEIDVYDRNADSKADQVSILDPLRGGGVSFAVNNDISTSDHLMGNKSTEYDLSWLSGEQGAIQPQVYLLATDSSDYGSGVRSLILTFGKRLYTAVAGEYGHGVSGEIKVLSYEDPATNEIRPLIHAAQFHVPTNVSRLILGHDLMELNRSLWAPGDIRAPLFKLLAADGEEVPIEISFPERYTPEYDINGQKNTLELIYPRKAFIDIKKQLRPGIKYKLSGGGVSNGWFVTEGNASKRTISESMGNLKVHLKTESGDKCLQEDVYVIRNEDGIDLTPEHIKYDFVTGLPYIRGADGKISKDLKFVFAGTVQQDLALNLPDGAYRVIHAPTLKDEFAWIYVHPDLIQISHSSTINSSVSIDLILMGVGNPADLLH